MKIDNDLEKTLSFDPKKVEKVYEQLVEVFQTHKPSVGEILIALSNLTYTLGASVEGYSEKGPGVEELERLYYSKPTIGIALMLQAMTTATWYEDWEKQQIEKT